MGILFLTVKRERCSDLLLWSAAWLSPPLRLMPMLTTATATALATEDSATLDLAMVDTVTLVLATATPVWATLMARGRMRLSPRLTPSTDTELTPTPPPTVTPPLPLPPLPSLPLSLPLLPLPSLPQPSLPLLLPLLPLPLPPLPSATPVSDTLVSDMLVSDMLVLVTPTARGRPRLSPRLMLTMATELTPTPDTAMLVSATLPPTAMATVWEPTELLELTTVKFVQLSSRSSTQSLPSVLLLKE